MSQRTDRGRNTPEKTHNQKCGDVDDTHETKEAQESKVKEQPWWNVLDSDPGGNKKSASKGHIEAALQAHNLQDDQ